MPYFVRLYTDVRGNLSLGALVAQRIEQKTSNLLVAGSIPAEGATCALDQFLR
jgi:hypothetical protein